MLNMSEKLQQNPSYHFPEKLKQENKYPNNNNRGWVIELRLKSLLINLHDTSLYYRFLTVAHTEFIHIYTFVSCMHKCFNVYVRMPRARMSVRLRAYACMGGFALAYVRTRVHACVWMYVGVREWLRVHGCACTSAPVPVRLHRCACTSVRTRVRVHEWVCMNENAWACVRKYARECAFIHKRVCGCVHMCIHLYSHAGVHMHACVHAWGWVCKHMSVRA